MSAPRSLSRATGVESPPLPKKPNYDFEKRRKEAERKKKKDAKREDRLQRSREEAPEDRGESPERTDDGIPGPGGPGRPAS